MTFNPGFPLSPPDPVPEDGVFLLPLCLTAEQFSLIMQTVELGGLSLGLGRQGAHLAPFWRAMAYINDPGSAGCVPVGGDNTMIRVDPQDNCQVQMSTDAGVSWVDVFRLDDCANIISGAQANTLPAGSAATASYDQQTGVLTVGVPVGADGIDGIDGLDGDQINSVIANTLPAGSAATASYNDATGVLTLGIPRGADGADGEDGANRDQQITPPDDITDPNEQKDAIFGACMAIMEFAYEEMIDALTRFEAAGDTVTAFREAIELIPGVDFVLEQLGIQDAIQIIEQISEFAKNITEQAWDVNLQRVLACELFCIIIADNNTLTKQSITDWHAAVTPSINAARTNTARMMLWWNTRNSSVIFNEFRLNLNNPDADWMVLCEDCNEDDPEPVGICGLTDFTLSDGGFIQTSGANSYVAAQGWTRDETEPAPRIRIDFDEVTITGITSIIGASGGDGDGSTVRVALFRNGNVVYDSDYTQRINVPSGTTASQARAISNVAADRMDLFLGRQVGGVVTWIQSIDVNCT